MFYISIWKRSSFFISICISHGFMGFVGPVCDLSKEIAMPPWSCCFQRSPPWRSSANSRMRWRRILLQLRSGGFCENLRRLNPNPIWCFLCWEMFFCGKIDTTWHNFFYVQVGLILAMTSFGSCAAWSVFLGLLGFSKVHFCSEKMLRRIWGAVTRVQHGWDALVIRFTVTDRHKWHRLVRPQGCQLMATILNIRGLQLRKHALNRILLEPFPSYLVSFVLVWRCEDGRQTANATFVFSFCWGLLSKTWMHRQESRDCQPQMLWTKNLDKQWNDFHGFSGLKMPSLEPKHPSLVGRCAPLRQHTELFREVSMFFETRDSHWHEMLAVCWSSMVGILRSLRHGIEGLTADGREWTLNVSNFAGSQIDGLAQVPWPETLRCWAFQRIFYFPFQPKMYSCNWKRLIFEIFTALNTM